MAPAVPFAKPVVSQLAAALRPAPRHPATEGLVWFVNVSTLADLVSSPTPVVQVLQGKLRMTVRAA